MTDRQDALRKLALLLSDNENLSDEISLSAQNPPAYIEKHARELRERGIYKPFEGLPWIALVEGLISEGKLIEFDWKETAEIFQNGVGELLSNRQDSAQAKDAFNDIRFESDTRFPDILKKINKVLLPFNLAVILIDILSDCYPVALVQATVLDEIIEMANHLERERVIVFFDS